MRPILKTAIVLVSGAAVIGMVPGTGLAATGGSDGPGGTVTVGVGDGGSVGPGSGPSPGGVAGTGGSPGGVGGASAGGGSGWVCTSTKLLLNDLGGTPPGGPTPGSWYSVTCTNQSTGGQVTQTEWIPNQTPGPAPTVAPAPVANPYAVALQAERTMVLPRPTLRFNPSGASVVNLPTWLWIDAGLWHPYTVTATIGTVSATAVATPTMVAWSMGDGHTVTCAGPGTAFDNSRPSSVQRTACSYAYMVSSAGQPSPDGDPNHGSFTVRSTVSWSVTWTAQGAPGGGVLPGLTTSATALLPVAQVESVNADGSALSSTPVGQREALP